MFDLVTKLLVFPAGQDQAGQVKHLAAGQLVRDRHNQVGPGLNPDNGRRAGPADNSRDCSRERRFPSLYATLGGS